MVAPGVWVDEGPAVASLQQAEWSPPDTLDIDEELELSYSGREAALPGSVQEGGQGITHAQVQSIYDREAERIASAPPRRRMTADDIDRERLHGNG